MKFGRSSPTATSAPAAETAALKTVQDWFSEHVKLDGKPYTLDLDQARAVADQHYNTLVVARAGSGKTRVIVAKVAYLVRYCGVSLDEIAIFMFNRAAAAEVNQRIAAVVVDGQPLASTTPQVASTFHKYALDLVKLAGEHPQIISETEHDQMIAQLLGQELARAGRRVSDQEHQELLSIVSGFVTRAGQKYPGLHSLPQLQATIQDYIDRHRQIAEFARPLWLHRLAFLIYRRYLHALTAPKLDFNLLMDRAAALMQGSPNSAITKRVSRLKYIMIDEYQDFSLLFYQLVSAMRHLASNAKVFAVGDDWQAINRFAGSDVDYFLNFQDYFPEDCVKIPLATNYRSCYRIVEYANRFMLTFYDPAATPAIPKHRQAGKITILNPAKVRFDASDWCEDGLGDARFQQALVLALGLVCSETTYRQQLPAAKLLKMLYKITKKHSTSDIMLLHRHNFTSFPGVTLPVLQTALKTILEQDAILDPDAYDRQVRCLTMHKSKGLEATVVILLEMDAEIVAGHHPHATLFTCFGDNLATETADQQRLLYVALTRAKQHLYILSSDQNPPTKT